MLVYLSPSLSLYAFGYGSDRAANMTGERNSVLSRVHEDSADCILFKCICHSLALCVRKRFYKLQSNLGFLLCEIYNRSSKSVFRRDNYKSIFQPMNAASESSSKNSSLPFQKMPSTRWLVRGKIIKNNILSHWSVRYKA